MKYNSYIKDAPLVSEIGLGAWQLGNDSSWMAMSEKDAIEIVHRSLAYGINFFDTAPNYGNGTSEERLGKALKGKDRSKIVINTKFGRSSSGAINFSSGYIRESLEGSLKRLCVDCIDSLLIHNPPPGCLDGNKNDHYEILERLIEEGKIKAYGASLDTCEEMKLLMNNTNAKVIEAFFNILHQDSSGAFDLAKEKEVGIIVKIPLDSGWLSGKYNAGSTFHDIRSRWTRQDIQTRAHLVNRVKEIVQSKDDLVQTAIAFCLGYDAVSTVIPGNVTLAQLKNNVESTNKSISRELLEKLEDFYQKEVKHLKLPW